MTTISFPISSMAHILVVDDNPAVLSLISRVLEAEGYTISTANCGRQALDILSRQPADLVVSDIRMPGMDGHVLCREAKTRYPRLTFIAVSAEGEAHPAAGSRFDAFIQKPFDIRDLLNTVARAVDG